MSFFYCEGEGIMAGGTPRHMLSGDATQPQHAFAMRALVIDVRLSVPHAQIKTVKGTKEPCEKTAKRRVFPPARRDIAGKQAKERIAKEKQIQNG